MDFHCMIEGKIVQGNPESFSTRKGLQGVRFQIRHAQRYRGSDGKWTSSKAQYFSVVCWGSLADQVLKSFKQDDLVTVSVRQILSIDSNGFAEVVLTAANVNASVRWDCVTPERKPKSATETIQTADGETLPVYDAPEPDRYAAAELAATF